MSIADEAEANVAAAYPPGVPRDIDVPDEPFTAAFERAAATYPNRTALYFMGAKASYAQVSRRVARAANALVSLGVKRGDRVAIALPNCPAHVVAFLAAQRIGAIVVENNPLYTDEELRHHLVDSGTTVVIAWQPTAARIIGFQPQTSVEHVVSVDVSKDLPQLKQFALRLPIKKAREQRAQLTAKVPASAIDWHTLIGRQTALPSTHPYPDPQDTAMLLYTGGTTGAPKGAMVSHANLISNAVMGEVWTGLTFENPKAAAIYSVLPFFHAYGLTLNLGFGLRIGGALVLFPKFAAREFVKTQKKIPATFLPAVPPMLDRIVAAVDAGAKVDFSSLTHVISGAMPLPAASAANWEALTGGLVIEGYGMTECSPIIAGNPMTSARRPGWLGLPFPSTRVRVVSEDDPTIDVPIGERGELLVHGPQVFQGYWNRDADTAAIFVVDDEGRTWLRTGDVVVQDDAGFLRMVDRMKEIIITGGFNVYPSQVEEVLRDMPGVGEVAVFGVPDAEMGEQVVAAIVPAKPKRRRLTIGPLSVAVPDLPHLEMPKIDLSKLDLPKVELPKIALPRFGADAEHHGGHAGHDASRVPASAGPQTASGDDNHELPGAVADGVAAAGSGPDADAAATGGGTGTPVATVADSHGADDDGEHAITLDEVRAFCAQRIARYAIPRQVVIVDELPRSQLGKVLRRQVKANLLAGEYGEQSGAR